MMYHLWVYTKAGGIAAISKESTVREILADRYPDRIYFFAELVNTPDYDETK